MKCNKCGHLNKSNTSYCVKCGSSLIPNNDAIRKYKEYATNTQQQSKLSTTKKLLIAIIFIAVLLVAVSAVLPPDLGLTSITPSNDTDVPIENIDQTISKLDTKVTIDSVSAKTGERVYVKALVTDTDGNLVDSGTTSITMDNTKYSGQVENGYVTITLPVLSENNYETTVLYEGNNKYNPSETRVKIEVMKQNTQIDAKATDENVTITLSTATNEKIPSATLIVTSSDGTQSQHQTDNEGIVELSLNPEEGKHEITINYEGDDKYNPSEKTITVGVDKKQTKLDTKYDEKEQLIIVTLTDQDNNRLAGETLKVTENGHEEQKVTNNNGEATISVYEGENKINIMFDGNNEYNSSETSVNMVVDHKIDDNGTQHNTTNDTGSNDTHIGNNTQYNSSMDDNNTTTKMDTYLNMNNVNNETIVTLEDTYGPVAGETIRIEFDNGTVINEKTDSSGRIILKLDNSTNSFELSYEGSNKYNPIRKTVIVE